MFHRLFTSLTNSPIPPANGKTNGAPTSIHLGRSLDPELSAIPASVMWTSLAINILGLALPLVALQIYDRILPNEATATLAVLILGLAIVVGLDTVMKVARSYLLGWEAAKLGCATHIDATRRFLGARRDEVDSEGPILWMDRLDALAQINAANTIPARIVLIDLLFVPVYLTLFAMVGGWLVLVPILTIGPFLVFIIRRGETLRSRLADRAGQDQRKQDFLVESLNGIRTIKSMAMEPQIQRRYERLQRRSAELNFEIIGLSQSLQSLGTLTSSITTVAVVTSGALIIITGGNLSVGALACTSLLAGRLMQPFMKGVGVWSEHQSRAVASERAAPLAAISARSRGASDENPICRGEISFSAVSYIKPQTTQRVLHNVNVCIPAKQTIAIRPTDSDGKNAFLGLIRGDCAATEGIVAIDGRPIDTGWGRELDPQISVVSNSSGIVAGTILDNLTMFGGARAVERVRHYARIIGLETAINLLPDGYDTMIGNTIVNLLPSGLIQQIAIVRTLAREPAILVFDEAYISLDRTTDPLVAEALADMKGERTIIIAAHRPSYLSLADTRYEITDGRLICLKQNDKNDREHHPAAQAQPTTRSTQAEEMIA